MNKISPTPAHEEHSSCFSHDKLTADEVVERELIEHPGHVLRGSKFTLAGRSPLPDSTRPACFECCQAAENQSSMSWAWAGLRLVAGTVRPKSLYTFRAALMGSAHVSGESKFTSCQPQERSGTNHTKEREGERKHRTAQGSRTCSTDSQDAGSPSLRKSLCQDTIVSRIPRKQTQHYNFHNTQDTRHTKEQRSTEGQSCRKARKPKVQT